MAAASLSHVKRAGTRSPDEPPVARMRGRWRHPGAVPHVAALMRATGVLAEMAEGKKKRAGLIIRNSPAADGDAAPRSPVGSRRVQTSSQCRITEDPEVICRNGLGST